MRPIWLVGINGSGQNGLGGLGALGGNDGGLLFVDLGLRVTAQAGGQ